MRSVHTRITPFSMIIEGRSGLDSIILVKGVREVEVRVRGEVHVHDSIPAYNFLPITGVYHEHVTFGIKNGIEQEFRTAKHRLLTTNFHFPWNAGKRSMES